MRKIKMDIRQFAVPSPRTGSIETHSGYGPTPLNGQEIHLLIQKKLTKEISHFIAEKSFSLSLKTKAYDFIISGRADGFIKETKPTIIEIKTAFDIHELKKKLLENHDHPYIWQLRTYGYFLFKETQVQALLILKLVSSRDPKKSLDIEIPLNIENYESWLLLRLEELDSETKIKEKLFNKRKMNAEKLTFPFKAPRPGQTELINSLESHFQQEIPLLIQASTGLGKTVGILFPALKEALLRGQKLVYVTPKNSQHEAPEKAVDLLAKPDLALKKLTLNSKQKMCLKPEPLCNPQYCEYAKDYYQKISDNNLLTKLQKLKTLTPKKLKTFGEKYHVCPFELSLEAIPYADIVICDYNYVFSPRSLLSRLTDPLLVKNELPNLIIDEAHNLPSRAQEYFSPQISLFDIQNLEPHFTHLPKHISQKAMEMALEVKLLINSYDDQKCSAKKINIDPAPFISLEKKVRELTNDYLELDVLINHHDPLLSFLNLLSEFISAIEMPGEEFFHTYQKILKNDILKITCSDASKYLQPIYKEFKNIAAFSATLKPFHYYQDLLGLPPTTKTIEFPSPFLINNRKILIIPQISTKFNQRFMSKNKIVEVLERIINLKKGNYLALFPSFEFMFQVLETLKLPGYEILTQQRNMSPALVESYLNQLRQEKIPTLLFGVQGGVFSEGVDYPGGMLIGVFIIGPALPHFDFMREQIKNYYLQKYGSENAFDYTYVYPAMAKAIQSAGRVIRTEEDRGIIILIDSRFLEKSYAETMPEEWFKKSPLELVSQKILDDIREFWEQ